MARAQVSDFLHNFRFHVTADLALGGGDPLAHSYEDGAEAGFQSASIPAVNVEAVEYREGSYTYTRKQPGIPTVDDCTLMRGVVMQDTALFGWIMAAIGNAEYRADLTIYQWDKAGKTPNQAVELDNAREYRLFNCFPITAKPAGDFAGVPRWRRHQRNLGS
jgi:phage tail-like protein